MVNNHLQLVGGPPKYLSRGRFTDMHCMSKLIRARHWQVLVQPPSWFNHHLEFLEDFFQIPMFCGAKLSRGCNLTSGDASRSRTDLWRRSEVCFWWFRNPGSTHQLRFSTLPHYLQGLIHERCCRISSINSTDLENPVESGRVGVVNELNWQDLLK